MTFQGAHAGSGKANDGNIGIALIGNFEKVPPSPQQLEALSVLIRELRNRYDIPRDQLHSHRALKALEGLPFTLCPGRFLEQVLPGLLNRAGRAG